MGKGSLGDGGNARANRNSRYFKNRIRDKDLLSPLVFFSPLPWKSELYFFYQRRDGLSNKRVVPAPARSFFLFDEMD
jgi:hypothetical protein